MATALVTGGTSGIGLAFARALAARGDDLVLVARDTERLAVTAAELSGAHGVHVETLAADLSDRDDVQRVAARVESADEPIDLLVSNAGFGVRSRLLDPDLTVHDRSLEVMVRAVLVLGGAAGRAMKARGHGAIVNVASTAAFVTMGHYSAIKSYVLSYSEALSNELAGTGVTVTALCPGWVRTEFHQRAAINASSIPDALWLDADALVAEALADVGHGKVVSIPSTRYAVLMTALRHLPRATVRTISRKLSSSRH